MAKRSIVPEIRYAQLSKSGRGFVLHIPKDLLRQLAWVHGTQLELWLSGGSLVVARAVSARSALLEGETAADAQIPPPGGPDEG